MIGWATRDREIKEILKIFLEYKVIGFTTNLI
jgi:hypothetical protein